MKKHFILINIVAAIFIATLTAPNIAGQSEEYALFLPAIHNNYDPSWQWQEPTTVTLSPFPWEKPLTVIDHQGRLHVIWSTLDAPRYIYHTYYDGISWSPQLPVAETLGYSKVLYAPLVDGNGRLHLVWHNDLGLGEPSRLMYAEFDGTAWSSEEEVYRTGNSGVQGMPHLDEQGNVRITLLDGLYTTTAYQATKSNNAWQLSAAIQPGHLTHWTWPDMTGGIRFYGSDSQNHMYYSHWQDGRFQVQNVQAAGTIYGRQTQLDGQNNLHTFWTATVSIPGGTVTGLYYQCLNQNLQWSEQTVISGQRAVSGLPIKASDANTQIALTWEEQQRDWFVTGVWQGCEITGLKDVPGIAPATHTLQAAAISDEANKLCVLAKKDFGSEFTAVCVDFHR